MNRNRYTSLLTGCGLWLTLLLTFYVYSPGLQGGFFLDDFQNILPLEDAANGLVRWVDAIMANTSGPLGRALSMASFAANLATSGLDIHALKYTNLLIHLLCGTLIFVFARQLFRLSLSEDTCHHRDGLALAVAALWLLSPLFVSTTLYVVQRMAQLATLFSLCALIVYVKARVLVMAERQTGWWLMASIPMVWLPLAIFGKENGALIPLLLLGVEHFFFEWGGNTRTRRVIGLGFILSVGLPTLLVLASIIVNPDYWLGAYENRSFTLTERLLTEPRILWHHVADLIAPYSPAMGFYQDDFPISRNLWSPWNTAIAIVAWMVVAASPLIRRFRRIRFLLFGPFFFLSGHLLESTVFPLELVFEHRNYLPGFGILFSFVLGLWQLNQHYRQPATMLVVFLAGLLIIFAFSTNQRAILFASQDGILLSAEKHHPLSGRLNADLAGYYAQRQQMTTAMEKLDAVARIAPEARPAVSLQKILVHCLAGKPIPDTLYVDLPETIHPGHSWNYLINTLRLLNRSILKGECPQADADPVLVKLLGWRHEPAAGAHVALFWDIRFESAQLLLYRDRREEAEAQLEECLRLDPGKPEPHVLRMIYWHQRGERVRARAAYEALRSRFPEPSPSLKVLLSSHRNVIQEMERDMSQGSQR